MNRKFHWWILNLTIPKKLLNYLLLECRRGHYRKNQLISFGLGKDHFISFSSRSQVEESCWTGWTFDLAYCHVACMYLAAVKVVTKSKFVVFFFNLFFPTVSLKVFFSFWDIISIPYIVQLCNILYTNLLESYLYIFAGFM